MGTAWGVCPTREVSMCLLLLRSRLRRFGVVAVREDGVVSLVGFCCGVLVAATTIVTTHGKRVGRERSCTCQGQGQS